MQRNRSTSSSVTRPARKTTGTFGYFVDENPATQTKGTSVQADFLNDLTDEISNVITSPLGGNTPLDVNSVTQLLTAIRKICDDKIAAAIAPATTNILQFVKTGNASPTLHNSTFSGTVTAGQKLDFAVTTVTLSSPPANTKQVLVRFDMFPNLPANYTARLYVRRNNAESWVMKLDTDSILSNAGIYESSATNCVPIEIDTGTNSFQFYVSVNETLLSPGGAVQVTTALYNEGYFTQLTVLTGI